MTILPFEQSRAGVQPTVKLRTVPTDTEEAGASRARGLGADPAPFEACFFGPPDRPLFGWLHRAHTTDREPRLGMVICNPFGYEAICAHRSLRRFAEDAACLGVPSLRFDYDGTGDTFGDGLEADRVATWVASIHHAIAYLANMCGTREVVLFGVRMGATLATLAAAERGDVAGIVAIAPVVSGRTYVRELRALQMALGLGPPQGSATPAPATNTTSAGPPAAPAAPAADDGQEAVGFVLSDETRRALGAIDLSKAGHRPAPEILLLDRDDLPTGAAWVDRLRAEGATVEHLPLPGYPEMVLDPHKARAPEAMRAATRAWLGRRREQASAQPDPQSVPPAGSRPEPRRQAAAQSTAILARHRDGTPAVLEEAGFIDPASILFGITARPASPVATEPSTPSAVRNGAGAPAGARQDRGEPGTPRPAARLGILLLNAGAIHHIGPSRLYVTLARAWAAEGHTVLRLDLSGIGDSGTRPGQADNLVYSPHAGADVATAVRHLRTQPGVSRVVILGLCSGAYHGFKAAVAGEPVSAIVPINPLTFFWKDGMSLDFPAHKVAEESHRYAQSALRLESWKKLARGEVHVRVLTQVLARRALSLAERHWRDLARQLGRPRPDDLGSELETLAAREIAVDFVFADGDPGMELLPLQGGSVVPRLLSQGKLRAHVITGPDHTFTARWSHPVLVEQLTSVIRSHARAVAPGGGGGGARGGAAGRRGIDRGDA